MALHKKKIKDSAGNPIVKLVKCGLCKVEKTNFTVHGGIATGRCGGHTCCTTCFDKLKAEEALQYSKDRGQSEAEYHISRRWGI